MYAMSPNQPYDGQTKLTSLKLACNDTIIHIAIDIESTLC
ncbi:hypothetical protein VCRA2114E123_30060 [Vibrio crassostreae]|nr:hypothetical protein VCRA2114E123_30060 [Vibrio crassostreae]CAK2030147.1 hypothetical protein VCRA2114E122_30060 [Vibrio crassostreae]